jgi:hypothetical protein
MNADQSRPNPESAPATDPAESPPSEAAAGGVTVTRHIPLWLLTLGVGLLSGLLSWAGAERMLTQFRIQDEAIYPANFRQMGGYEKRAVDAEVQGAAQRAVERKKAAASFGWLGAVLAVSLALVGGLAGGSPRTAALGALVGGLAGEAVGAGLSWIVVPVFFRYQTPASGLLVLFLTHAAIFVGIGAVAGLALGLGLGGRPATVRAFFGGMLGGLFGTIALEAINSLAFPLMRTLEPIASEPIARLVTYLCVAVFTAGFAGWAAGSHPERPRRKAPGEG